jgi:hypothetical protein
MAIQLPMGGWPPRPGRSRHERKLNHSSGLITLRLPGSGYRADMPMGRVGACDTRPQARQWGQQCYRSARNRAEL